MKKHLLSLLLLLFVAAPLFSMTGRYRLILREDPATSITIGWDQFSGRNPKVYYGPEDYGMDFTKYPEKQEPNRIVRYKGMHNYFVRLNNLKPDQPYYFVIVDTDGASRRFWFMTLPDDKDARLSIVAGGDSRRSSGETTPHEPRIKSNMMVKRLRPHFVAFGGDYTNRNTNGQWQSWMDDWQQTIGDDGRIIPILPTRGNHERSNEDVVNLFDVKDPRAIYAMDFADGLLRIYTLNTMYAIAGEQTEWLEKDLKKHQEERTWLMAQYHHPIAPHQSNKPYKTLQYQLWAPLFYEYGVSLVVECDSHVVKTTWPVKPSYEEGSEAGFVRDDASGTVYVGEGSWGLTRVDDVEYNWTRDHGSFTQVKWIFVDKEEIQVRTVKTDNAAYVATVNDDDRFAIPAGAQIWETENGSVVSIKKKDKRLNE